MPQQRLRDFGVDHRVIVVEPTPAMRKIAEEVEALQTKYRELEEAEQRRKFHAFKQMIRTSATERIHDEFAGLGAA